MSRHERNSTVDSMTGFDDAADDDEVATRESRTSTLAGFVDVEDGSDTVRKDRASTATELAAFEDARPGPAGPGSAALLAAADAIKVDADIVEKVEGGGVRGISEQKLLEESRKRFQAAAQARLQEAEEELKTLPPVTKKEKQLGDHNAGESRAHRDTAVELAEFEEVEDEEGQVEEIGVEETGKDTEPKKIAHKGGVVLPGGEFISGGKPRPYSAEIEAEAGLEAAEKASQEEADFADAEGGSGEAWTIKVNSKPKPMPKLTSGGDGSGLNLRSNLEARQKVMAPGALALEVARVKHEGGGGGGGGRSGDGDGEGSSASRNGRAPETKTGNSKVAWAAPGIEVKKATAFGIAPRVTMGRGKRDMLLGLGMGAATGLTWAQIERQERDAAAAELRARERAAKAKTMEAEAARARLDKIRKEAATARRMARRAAEQAAEDAERKAYQALIASTRAEDSKEREKQRKLAMLLQARRRRNQRPRLGLGKISRAKGRPQSAELPASRSSKGKSKKKRRINTTSSKTKPAAIKADPESVADEAVRRANARLRTLAEARDRSKRRFMTRMRAKRRAEREEREVAELQAAVEKARALQSPVKETLAAAGAQGGRQRLKASVHKVKAEALRRYAGRGETTATTATDTDESSLQQFPLPAPSTPSVGANGNEREAETGGLNSGSATGGAGTGRDSFSDATLNGSGAVILIDPVQARHERLLDEKTGHPVPAHRLPGFSQVVAALRHHRSIDGKELGTGRSLGTTFRRLAAAGKSPGSPQRIERGGFPFGSGADGSDDFMTVEEFGRALRRLDILLDELELRDLVAAFDLNGSGVIDMFEFERVLRKYVKRAGASGGCRSSKKAPPSSVLLQAAASAAAGVKGMPSAGEPERRVGRGVRSPARPPVSKAIEIANAYGYSVQLVRRGKAKKTTKRKNGKAAAAAVKAAKAASAATARSKKSSGAVPRKSGAERKAKRKTRKNMPKANGAAYLEAMRERLGDEALGRLLALAGAGADNAAAAAAARGGSGALSLRASVAAAHNPSLAGVDDDGTREGKRRRGGNKKRDTTASEKLSALEQTWQSLIMQEMEVSAGLDLTPRGKQSRRDGGGSDGGGMGDGHAGMADVVQGITSHALRSLRDGTGADGEGNESNDENGFPHAGDAVQLMSEVESSAAAAEAKAKEAAALAKAEANEKARAGEKARTEADREAKAKAKRDAEIAADLAAAEEAARAKMQDERERLRKRRLAQEAAKDAERKRRREELEKDRAQERERRLRAGDAAALHMASASAAGTPKGVDEARALRLMSIPGLMQLIQALLHNRSLRGQNLTGATAEELKRSRHIRRRAVRRAFNRMDDDDSRAITQKEVSTAFKRLDIVVSARSIRRLVHEFDVDEDGTIDCDEWVRVIVFFIEHHAKFKRKKGRPGQRRAAAADAIADASFEASEARRQQEAKERADKAKKKKAADQARKEKEEKRKQEALRKAAVVAKKKIEEQEKKREEEREKM